MASKSRLIKQQTKAHSALDTKKWCSLPTLNFFWFSLTRQQHPTAGSSQPRSLPLSLFREWWEITGVIFQNIAS